MIDNAIKLMIYAKNDKEEEQKLKERYEKYREWVESHRVKEVKAGE